MFRKFVIIAGISGFLAVALGAFGAHGLRTTLEIHNRLSTFQTANQYHMYHTLGLLAVAWLTTRYSNKPIEWAGYLFIAGTLVFSGSLYILAIADLGIMGAVAPIGGVMLLIGWSCIAVAAWRQESYSDK